MIGTAPSAARLGWAQRERHLSDLVRVGLGLLVLTLAALPVRPDSLSRAERGAFELVNGLWDVLRPVVWVVMQLGSLAAVPVLAVVALVLRRRWMAVDLLVSGGIAWTVAKVVKDAFGRPRPGGLLTDVVFRVAEPTGMGFVSGHTAVAVALATAAAPYVPRRFRWLLGATAITVGLARIYVGAHLPLDVVGGAGLGWAVGAGWRLLVGAPSVRPSADRVERGLTKLGFDVVTVEPRDVAARVSAPFNLALAGGQRLFAKVVVEEIVDRDVLVRMWRRVRRRGKDEHRFRAPRSQVEHEAAIALAAERAGVRSPSLSFARELDGGAAVVAFAELDGADLAERQDLDEAALADIFTEVGRLHDAGIAHGALVRENLVATPDGIHLVDFGYGLLAAREQDLAEDLKELLVSLAARTSADRVVRMATKVRGAAVVARALGTDPPWTEATRADLQADAGLVDRVCSAGTLAA